MLTDDEIDGILDDVLQAAESGQHYSMNSTTNAMRAAMRAIESAVVKKLAKPEAQPVAWIDLSGEEIAGLVVSHAGHPTQLADSMLALLKAKAKIMTAPAAQPSTEPSELVRAARDALAALEDILNGWKYIRRSHGDLYGVGWDRAESKAATSIDALRRALAAGEAKGDGR